MTRRSRNAFTAPPALRPGDTVALIAPASPPERIDSFDVAQTRLEAEGFQVVTGSNARKRCGFIAGSDRERLRDLVSAFRSKSIKAVWCVRGGYGTGRILAGLQRSLFKDSPKILIGSSDITNLHAISFGAKLISFHGPMPNGLTTDNFPDYSFRSLLRNIRGDVSSQGSIWEGHPERSPTLCIRPGKGTGRLAGGNLSMLCSLLGTPFFPDLRNCLLYLEEVSEAPYRIDRMLTQLLSAGALNSLKGIALGTFKNCEYKPSADAEYKQTLQDVLRDRLFKLKVPVVYGLPFGHIPLNATIPNGAIATLDARKGELVIEQPPTLLA